MRGPDHGRVRYLTKKENETLQAQAACFGAQDGEGAAVQRGFQCVLAVEINPELNIRIVALEDGEYDGLNALASE
jgi:hypothetical protein